MEFQVVLKGTAKHTGFGAGKIREGQLYLEDEAKYIEYSRAANRITGRYISDRL